MQNSEPILDVSLNRLVRQPILLISFSGGRTSAFMTKYIMSNCKYDNYKKIVLFANTGKERVETLEFINECDRRWNFGTIWIEADVQPEKGVGTKHKIVTFETASRNGEPFEAMIKKYGIPNQSFPHCTRELKLQPIADYMRANGYKDYITAMGIRADELDRLKDDPKFIYPLANEIKTNERFIREWWKRQEFDLQLADYEGNCDLCWKKSLRKNLTQLQDKPQMADWWDDMENKYSKGKYYFYRGNRSAKMLLEEAGKQNFTRWTDLQLLRERQTELFDTDLDFELPCHCKAS